VSQSVFITFFVEGCNNHIAAKISGTKKPADLSQRATADKLD
jgi:hypothetical protein